MTDVFSYLQDEASIPLNPEKIKILPVNTAVIINLQQLNSKAIWRQAPGRGLGFIFRHEYTLLGLCYLSSPVINLADRDKHLKLSKDPTEKGNQLRNYMDMSVCVGIQPLAWYWNICKLIALVATTFGDFYKDRYGDELKGITTTSLYGKGSIYNRIYKFLGYTKGWGHQHISDRQYEQMLDWMKRHDVKIPSSAIGEGSNERMRRIATYRKHSGDNTVSLFHGQKRGIYYHESVSPEKRKDIIYHWYNRWGLPRYLRKKLEKPPYYTGKA